MDYSIKLEWKKPNKRLTLRAPPPFFCEVNMSIKRISILLFSALFLVVAAGVGDAEARRSNPCNPCAMKKNACNPCAKANKQIRKKHITDKKKLVAMGKKLWNDPKLGKSGLACMTCHDDYEGLNLSRHHGIWPHNVPGMTNDIVTLTQMINYCMINPMEGKQIDPNSIKMTAMQAYYTHYAMQKHMNPCGMKHKGMKDCNPCAMKHNGMNPCNPCAMKHKGMNPCNPCAMKHKMKPCNPCAMKHKSMNPCNPCAKR